MLATMQKNRKQIFDLQQDLEVINPIESKTILGGNWYDDWDLGVLNTVFIFNGHASGQASYGQYNIPSSSSFLNDWFIHNNSYDTGGNSGNDDNGNDNGNDNANDEFPDHICLQLNQGTTCATMALSYVANYFGATGLSSSDFAEMVGKNYMSMMVGTTDGLTGAQLHTIMANIFQSTQITTYAQLETNTANGVPVLATINMGGNIGHEVVITSFNPSNGNISYMDSLIGSVVNSNIVSETITFTGSMYAVTGVQNNAAVNQYKNDTNDIVCAICGH